MRYSKFLLAVPVALIAAALLHACGGGTDSNSGAASNTVTVTSYITDDLGGYESVVLTVNKVELRHPVTPRCTIIDTSITVDAAELGREKILEQVNTTQCAVGPYNRLYVELGEEVFLQQVGGTIPQGCKFVSYMESGFPLPNRLACNGDTCSLNITGAVNLIARNHEHVALDVDLKQFTVVTNGDSCEVTLKVSPIHADGKLAAGFRKRISGTVSDLSTGTDTCTVTTVRGHSFMVQYAGVADQLAAGLETLLTRAMDDKLRTSVRCQTIDTATSPPTCTAQTDATQPLKAIAVKAKGTITNLAPAPQTTFTLNYGAVPTMLPVNYAKAVELGKVQGTLVENASADVMLYGFDADFYLARDVEVE
jgi:hypothetical protein